MKKFAFIAVLGALAACTPEADAPAESAVEETAAAVTAADGGPSHGVFKVTRADGTVFTDALSEDGTYLSTNADGTTETGRWEQKSPELFCATPDTEGAKQKCYEEQVDDKGVYTSKDPETGEVSVVERVEA